MDWNISYLEEDGIVLVKMLNPIDTLEKTKQIGIDSTSVGNYNQSQRYLIDHRGVGFELSLLEVEKVPALFKEAGIDPHTKIALLMDPNSPSKQMFEFTKNVLSLASIKFKLFTDENETIDWLKADEPVASSKPNQQ